MIDYEKLISFVKEKHASHPFAGFDHIERVHNICMQMAKGSDADVDVLRVAAYVHDIAVPVFGPEKHYERAAEVLGDLLDKVGVSPEKQKQVFDIIRTHTRYTKTEPLTLEAKILKDADSIDYLGAIGIMRAVMRSFRNKSYAGNVSIQGKQILGDLIDTVDDAFATEKGKQIGKERIDFINMFIKRLDKEISI